MLPQQDPPDGWPKPARSPQRVLSVALFGVLTVIAVAVTVSAAAVGEVGQALIFGLGAVLFGHLTGMSVSSLRQPPPSDRRPSTGITDRGERGLAFPYSRWAYYWLSSVLVMIVLVAAGLAVGFAAQATAVGWAMAIVLAASALFLVGFLVVVLRLAPGTVVVTPTGIYHRSLALEHFVPWEAVVDVLAREGRTPWITVKAMPTSGTRERRYTGRLGAGAEGLPFMIVRAYWLGANAVPAYRALKHYFHNPAERSRLGQVDQPAGI
jgi:hypothetical protein